MSLAMDSVNVIIQTLQTLHICVSMARAFARIVVTVYVSHATGSVKIIQSNYGLCKDYTVHVSLAMDSVNTIQSMYHRLWTL